ncbi:hypothetical protein [Chryseobacterium sp. MP_3.2]|uniref:hypothetical protein n=1 Tax=Chryseobacterium sp. MP_3.2 TaxID=3071712 RepID=UPI002DFE97F6|nr:hypothetical protein [Chryseobacterium sp. MP_3.2]
MKNLYFTLKNYKVRLLFSVALLFLLNAIGYAQINTVLNTQIKGEITAVAGGSTSSTYNITTPKPAGATTVNKIFIYYSHVLRGGSELGANAITVNGVNPNLNIYTVSGTSLVSYTRYAEVSTTATALVNTLDTLAAGTNTTIAVNEGSNSAKIEGVGILILWNVPTKPLGRFVIQMGTLITGPLPASQSFLVNAIDKTLPGFSATLGVGISFSTGDFNGNNQLSQLKIGGATPTVIVTSTAGGYDDGQLSNGALITLGGFGDSPTTNASDELYDVASFLTNGQTQISYSLLDVDNVYDDYINVVYFTSTGISSPCLAGTVAPALSATTLSNICPATTANLTTITASNKPTGTTLSWHTGSPATTANAISGNMVAGGTYYASFFDSVGNCYSPTTAVTVTINPCFCYNLPNTATAGTNTQHGITLLKRAGGSSADWPMVRKSALTALESNSKGFVITRMTTAQINAITSPQEGMMVFDTSPSVKCLKIYSDGVWSCFNTPACP